MTRIGAVVPAAGRGERLGAGPKALLAVGGVPMVTLAVRALRSCPAVVVVVVAAPADRLDGVAAAADGATVVAGGATRQESVRRAVAALPADVDAVLVHDAARPLTPAAVVDRVAAALAAGADAVVPVLPVADTVKEVDADGAVTRTLDRSSLRAVQTPQGFRREVLARAHDHAGPEAVATDDAALVEAIGVRVQTVAGAAEAFKVTTTDDLALAEALVAQRGQRVRA